MATPQTVDEILNMMKTAAKGVVGSIQRGSDILIPSGPGIGISSVEGPGFVPEQWTGSLPGEMASDKTTPPATINKVGGVPGAQPIATPTTPATTAGTNNEAPPQQERDIYAELHKLTDEQFKRFADDKSHGLPGIGYVTDAKPKFDKNGKYSGEGKFLKYIENPAEKPPQPVSVAEQRLKNETMIAQGHLAAGVGAKKNAQAAIEERKDAAANKLDLDKQKDWENHYGTWNPESSKMELNAPLAVAKTIAEDGEVPAAHRGLEIQILKGIKPLEDEFDKNKEVQDYFKKLGIGQDDPRYIRARKLKALERFTQPPKEKK
jgi:hypothetical protein